MSFKTLPSIPVVPKSSSTKVPLQSDSTFQNLPSLLTSAEVCSLLRFSQKTLQRWRKARKLTFVRRSGRYLFPAADVDRFIAARLVRAA